MRISRIFQLYFRKLDFMNSILECGHRDDIHLSVDTIIGNIQAQ